jgi:hypothetical protein
MAETEAMEDILSFVEIARCGHFFILNTASMFMLKEEKVEAKAI